LNSLFASGREPQPIQPISWKEEWIFSLAKAFEGGTPIHTATGGAHSCYLALEGKLLYCCEDLGRHNALDKVIGLAMRDGVDLHHVVLYTSGRVPTDMAMKAIRAGIPILVSKTTPTNLAVELAEQYGLTLICSAKSNRFVTYTKTRA
jgi:FdhD protein